MKIGLPSEWVALALAARATHAFFDTLNRTVFARGRFVDAVRQTKAVSESAPTQFRSGRAELTPCGQDDAQRFHGGTIWCQAIRHDRLGLAMAFQGLPEKSQCRRLVTAFLNEAFEHFTLVVDGAPEVMLYAIDLHKDLVEMPPPVLICPHGIDASPLDLGGEDRSEPVPPEPNRLMRDVDAALMQQVFHIPQPKRVRDVHHHHQADDLGARLEVAEKARIAHARKAAALHSIGKPISSDWAPQSSFPASANPAICWTVMGLTGARKRRCPICCGL